MDIDEPLEYIGPEILKFEISRKNLEDFLIEECNGRINKHYEQVASLLYILENKELTEAQAKKFCRYNLGIIYKNFVKYKKYFDFLFYI